MTHAERIALAADLANGAPTNTIHIGWLRGRPTYLGVTTPERVRASRKRHTEAAGEQINFRDLSRPGGRLKETYAHTSPLK